MKALENQVAVITGGTAGIGKAIAYKLAEEGAKIVIFGTNTEKGTQAVDEIRTQVKHDDIYFYPVDVSQTAVVDETLKKIYEKFGQIDILVNNAGITADQLLMKMTEEEWDRVLDINLKSCFNTCKAVVRSMMKARKGRIINISSVVGLMGNAGQSNYAASKAGMIGFTKSLAKELAGRNILVNCVAPGFVNSNMTNKLNDAQKESILKEIPLGRMGEPHEIANIVWFLSGPMSEYITGQVFAVDGGMTM